MNDEHAVEEQEQELEGEVEPGKRRRKPKMVPARAIDRDGQSLLVQWADKGRLRRGYVPAEALVEGMVAKEILDAAIPAGVPWEELVDTSAFTPEALARELEKRGIFCAADVSQSPNRASQAVLAATGLGAGALHRIASEYENTEV